MEDGSIMEECLGLALADDIDRMLLIPLEASCRSRILAPRYTLLLLLAAAAAAAVAVVILGGKLTTLLDMADDVEGFNVDDDVVTTKSG